MEVKNLYKIDNLVKFGNISRIVSFEQRSCFICHKVKNGYRV